jgi:hypothetical protein
MKRSFATIVVAALLTTSAPFAFAQGGSAAPPGSAKPPPPPGSAKPGPDTGKKPKNGDKKNEPASEFAADVMVLYASNSKKGVDKRIPEKEELKKPPFSSYDSYELREEKRLPLKTGEATTMRLPNGRILQVKLLAVKAKDQMVRISVSINEPQGKDFLPLLEVAAKPGKAFIVAGQRFEKGMLALVIRVAKP